VPVTGHRHQIRRYGSVQLPNEALLVGHRRGRRRWHCLTAARRV